MKTKGKAMRMFAIANVETLAETRKARPTPARLTRDMVRAKQRNVSKAGFNPEGMVDTCTQEDRKLLSGCSWHSGSEIKWKLPNEN